MSGCICPSPHPGECPWVRVESEDELRAGMAVLLSKCPCGKASQFFLSRREAIPIGFACGTHGSDCRAWKYAGTSCGGPFLCPTKAIAEGRLYRLRDLPPEQAKETSAPREKETVR